MSDFTPTVTRAICGECGESIVAVNAVALAALNDASERGVAGLRCGECKRAIGNETKVTDYGSKILAENVA